MCVPGERVLASRNEIRKRDGIVTSSKLEVIIKAQWQRWQHRWIPTSICMYSLWLIVSITMVKCRISADSLRNSPNVALLRKKSPFIREASFSRLYPLFPVIVNGPNTTDFDFMTLYSISRKMYFIHPFREAENSKSASKNNYRNISLYLRKVNIHLKGKKSLNAQCAKTAVLDENCELENPRDDRYFPFFRQKLEKKSKYFQPLEGKTRVVYRKHLYYLRFSISVAIWQNLMTCDGLGWIELKFFLLKNEYHIFIITKNFFKICKYYFAFLKIFWD